MIQKRNGFLMLILIAATCSLCGCTEPHPIADPVPTTGPAISEPAAPTTAPKLGDSLSDPIKMYLGDIYTISVNLAGLPGGDIFVYGH